MSTKAVEKRPCANSACGKKFAPKRPHQKFHEEKCRYEEWNRQHPRLKNTEDVSTS